jgi:hypothetical protein
MSTTIEAILGAVHLDGGDNALSAAMANIGLTHELLNQAVTLLFLLPLFILRYTYPLTCNHSRFLLHGHSKVKRMLDL